jgi:carbonic anhydrase
MSREPYGEVDRILAENLRYAESFDRSALTAAPLRKVAIVACMDSRLLVEDALGLRPGDAHIIRNAGGLATDDVIRSLVVSQQLLGTNEIVLIEHTGCGLFRADEPAIRARIAADLGIPIEEVSVALGSFSDLEANVREQVAVLREHRWLRRVPVHGLLFDVATGRLHEVA